MLRVSAVVCSLLFVNACSETGGEDPRERVEPEVEEGPGEFDIGFRESPSYFTKMDAPEAGNSPHGAVQIWYSTNVRDVIEGDAFTVPVGTVSVKTGDPDEDGEINAITVMIKRAAGYDPDNNDWEYQMRTPAGDIVRNEEGELVQGPVGMCIDCHGAFAQKDFLGGTTLGR